ncbi:LamG-like jellyroll fold domain-containing protein [Microbacterium sp. NPDC089696]|uniref:LamG-like jellyroll fold domain-containing protein n=1 Tax=Microbacterium sp. NPDC089696 TaxID=3364199 RepID=UPI003813E46B
MHIIGGGRRATAGHGDARRTRATTLSAAVATVLALALTIGPLAVPTVAVADTAPASGVPETVTADALPTVQIDGVVYAQEVVGNTVYVGGSFAKARPAGSPAGTNETPRANLLAYDLTTGALISSWNPGANGTVLDIKKSADGSRIYVAGAFSQTAGAWRYRVAAFDTATGALATTWAPATNGRVDALAITESSVYLAGEFTTVNGVQRTKVASVSAVDGTVSAFSATVDGGYGAKGVVVSPDRSKVVIAGSFTSVNGSTNPGRGITALDANTGTLMPWAMNSVLRNGGTAAAMSSLAADADGVYGTGTTTGGTSEDGFEGAFRASWADGSLIWMEDCHGDSYDVAPVGDTIYVVGHPHYCGNVAGFPETKPTSYKHSLAFSKAPSGQPITKDTQGYRNFAGNPAGSLLQWYPEYVPGNYTGQYQGPWQVSASGDYLLVGGEFLKVNGASQQGIVRFAKKTVAPNKQGPQVQGGAWPVDAVSFRTGVNRVSWSANHDRDNQTLTYRVFRQDLGTTAPIHETTQLSNFWTRPAMSYRDTTAVPGTTYNYRVTATDAHGNSTQTDWKSVTTAVKDGSTAYDAAVLASGAVNYWPLQEKSGTAGYNWATGSDLVVTGATRGGGTSFSGTASSSAGTTSSTMGPQAFTVEAWFTTASTAGGKIIGFGSSSSGNSVSSDRHVYIDGAGRVSFGVWPNAVRTVTSGTGYNDDQWHHVVASLSSAGQVLWIDGVKVGERTDTTTTLPYTGFWRVGGDTVGGWPHAGTSAFLSGSISNVATYDRALTRTEIDAHRVASGRASTLPAAPPADAYGSAVFHLDPTLYWRLTDTGTGPKAADRGMNDSDGKYLDETGALVKGEPGAITGSPNKAVRWAPATASTGAGVVSKKQYTAPQIFTVEAWFQTTTTAGGKIVGFGDSAAASSGVFDRHVYMTPDGRLHFGVWDKRAVAIDTPVSYNDGRWHHVVAQLSGGGMALYVDGALVGSNTTTSAHDYTGHWHVGNDSTWGGATTFTGTIDEVAVYGSPLTAAQIDEHHRLGVSGTVNIAPVAAFTPTATALAVTVDGSASADPDGAIAAYAWTFGDGGTATGPTATHTYAAAGTYPVTLTVTDAVGATASVTTQVTVAAPVPANELATDAFTRAVPAGGWGSADLGGAWTLQGGSAAYSVADGKGVVSLSKSNTRTARLGLSGTDAVIRVSVAADQVSTGGAATATVIGRQVNASNYAARVRFETGGAVRLYLLRDEVALGSYLMPGVTYTPGTVLNVALSVTGTSPTTLAAKVWRATDPEPTTWQVTATDTTPALQAAGTVGLMNTVSSASTLPSTVFTWDDLTITRP